MKNIRRGSRFLTLFLALAMVVAMLPLSVSAAKGDLDNDVYSTGLIGGINVEDTISLPIKIFDYENDGMLFEYAEAYASGTGTAAAKTATDFGATFATDFCSASSIANAMCYNLGHATRDLVTGTYANYMRATYIRNGTEAPFTAYGRSGAIIPNDLGGLALDSIRYLVLVYRSNVETGNIGFFVERTNADRNNTKNRVGDLSFTNKGDDGKGSSTNWTYAVYDLKQGNLANSWTTTNLGTAASIWTTFPMKNTSQWIDIAHVALFSDATQAAAFGEYAITDGSDRGDNRAFGLLRGSRTQGDAGSTDTNGLGSAFFGIFKYNNTSADYGAAIETITQLGWTTENINVNEVATNLGYTLLGEFRGIANAGLLESSLSEDGYPVYKEEVVTYLAYLLKDSLELEERDPKTGWKNYRYVKGTPSPVYGNVDLATALRNAIDDKTISNGDCNAAKNKQLIGKWSDINGNISTYHDAAYFLLNSIFFPDSYNIPQDDYNYLVLSAGTDATTSKKVYVFDGGFTSDDNGTSAVTYDTDKHTIQNNAAAYKTAFQYSDKDGDKTTLNPFLPVTDGNNEAGQTNNLYYQYDGVINLVKKTTGKDTLYKRDFNYVMVSEGEFVYHADDELFFEFEGDDDVYLFINNELVLDLGSAHGIDYYRFNLNDYQCRKGRHARQRRNKKRETRTCRG